MTNDCGSKFYNHFIKYSSFSLPVQLYLAGHDCYGSGVVYRINFICKLLNLKGNELSDIIDQENQRSSNRSDLDSFIDHWCEKLYNKTAHVLFFEKSLAFVFGMVSKFESCWSVTSFDDMFKSLEEFFNKSDGDTCGVFKLFDKCMKRLLCLGTELSLVYKKTNIDNIYLSIYAFLLLDDFERCAVLGSKYIADAISGILLSSFGFNNPFDSVLVSDGKCSMYASLVVMHDKVVRIFSLLIMGIARTSNENLKTNQQIKSIFMID